jgi:3'-5' exoribonuclease
MPEDVSDLEKLNLRQLKQAVGPTPEPFRVHAQVEAAMQKPSSAGKPYLELKLNDGTESITWRIFDSNSVFNDAASLQKGDWIELGAYWESGKYGLEPRNCGLRVLKGEEVESLLAGDQETRDRQRLDYETISRFVESIIDPRLRGVGMLFLQQHGDRFKRAAAARDYHHARRGGLVEHVAQMMRCAVKIAEAYPGLNRDLLVAGVLFHDCGKLWENNYNEGGFNMPYSIHGELIGHISLGLEVVNKLWRQLMDAPEAADWASLDPTNELVRLHLLHLIGSHHGEMAFGSPVLPKTPEAIVLHHVDNIDAKLEMFRRAYETSSELGNGIVERVRPMPANAVRPLAHLSAPSSSLREDPPTDS